MLVLVFILIHFQSVKIHYRRPVAWIDHIFPLEFPRNFCSFCFFVFFGKFLVAVRERFMPIVVINGFDLQNNERNTSFSPLKPWTARGS